MLHAHCHSLHSRHSISQRSQSVIWAPTARGRPAAPAADASVKAPKKKQKPQQRAPTARALALQQVLSTSKLRNAEHSSRQLTKKPDTLQLSALKFDERKSVSERPKQTYSSFWCAAHTDRPGRCLFESAFGGAQCKR